MPVLGLRRTTAWLAHAGCRTRVDRPRLPLATFAYSASTYGIVATDGNGTFGPVMSLFPADNYVAIGRNSIAWGGERAAFVWSQNASKLVIDLFDADAQPL